jgi:hypothetical protein
MSRQSPGIEKSIGCGLLTVNELVPEELLRDANRLEHPSVSVRGAPGNW